MAKDDEFDFEAFDMDDFSDIGSNNKKQSFFKDLAKGIVIGSAKKMEDYIPALGETKESISDMGSQIRDQMTTVSQMKSKIDNYTKVVTDDGKKIIENMRNTKGLGNKIREFNAGIDTAKKDLAYAIDPNAAESFDMDKMFGDDEPSSGTTVTPGKSTSKVDSNTSTRLRNEKLGLDPNYGITDVSPSDIASATGGRSGRKTIINNNFGDGAGSKARLNADRLGNEVLRETMFVTSASIVSSQARIFKQSTIINTKQHLEKMNALNRIAEATTLSAKFIGEQGGPTQKQMAQRLEKFEAQMTDMIALMRENSENSFDSMRRAMYKQQAGRKNISDFVTSYGGIDFGKLYSHIFGQAKDAVEGSPLGMLAGMKDMLPMLLMGGSNKTSIGQTIGKLIGGAATRPFKGKLIGLSDKIQDAIPSTLMSVYGKMKNSDNSFLRGFADLINIDTGTDATVKLNNRNRAAKFDTVTRKSITEVIPGYLSKILQAVSGSDDELTFDHKTSRFVQKKVLQQQVQSNIDNAGMGNFSSIKYKINQAGGNQISEKTLDNILRQIMLTDDTFNINDPAKMDKYKKIFESAGIDKQSIATFYDVMSRNLSTSDRNLLNNSTAKARATRKRDLENLGIDLQEYGTSSLVGASQLDSQIKDLERRKLGVENLSGTGGLDLRGTKEMMRRKQINAGYDLEIAQLKSIKAANGDLDNAAQSASPMGKLYDLLLRGILVFPQGEGIIPSHIKKAIKADASIKASKRKAQENYDKATQEYEKARRQVDSGAAEEISAERYNRTLTLREKLYKMLGGDVENQRGDSSIASRIMGSNSKIGKVLDSFSDNSLVKAYNTFVKTGREAIDNASAKIDSVIDDGGINFGKVKTGVVNTSTYKNASAFIKSLPSKIRSFKNDVKTDEGRKKLMMNLSKMKDEEIQSILDKKDQILATAGGKFVIDIAEQCRTPKGRKNIAKQISKFSKDSMDKVSDFTKDKTSKITETINPYIDSVKNKTSEINEKYKQTKFAEKVDPYINSAKDKVTDFAENVSSKVNDTADKVKKSSLFGSMKSKFYDTFDKLNEKLFGETQTGNNPEDNDDLGVDTPKNMNTKFSKDSMDKETKAKLKDTKKAGLFGVLGAMVTGTMSKLNRVLFGTNDNELGKGKEGLVQKALGKFSKVTGAVSNFLFGNKKDGRYGILHQIMGPTLKVLEDARHKIVSKILLPFKSIGKEMKESLKWGMRDAVMGFQNMLTKFTGSVDERRAKKAAKNKKKAEKLAKRNAKRIAAGKDPISANVAGRLGDMVLSPFALATKISLNQSQKRMQKMLAGGRISQEEYDEWLNQQEADLGSEEALHKKNSQEIRNFQEQLDLSRVKDAELKAKLAGYSEAENAQKAKINKMTYKDIKDDEKRAKAQRKLNAKKIKAGEKLTYEEEMGALTEKEKYYRMQDDAKKKYKAEIDRQAATAEKERTEMERSRTDAATLSAKLLSGLLYRVSRGKSGKPYENDKVEKEPTATENIQNEIKKDQSTVDSMDAKIKSETLGADQTTASQTDTHIDVNSGFEEGSRADQIADAERAQNASVAGNVEKLVNLVGATNAMNKIQAAKNDTDNEEKKGFFSKILSMFGNIGTLLAGIGSLAAGGLAVKGISNGIKNIFKRGKNEGAAGVAGELLGYDRAGDSKFNYDGTKKGWVQQAADRFHAGRFIVQHKGLQKTAKLLSGGLMKTVKGGGNLIGGAAAAPVKALSKLIKAPAKMIKPLGKVSSKAANIATKIDGVAMGVSKVASKGGKLGTKITELLTKFFNIPKIAKHIPKGKVGKLIASIGGKVAKSSVAKGLGSALKFISGPAGIAIMAAADFATGAAQAKRYFKIGKNDKATAGMRIAAGLANALNNGLLLGLVPMDWLVETIYRIVADPKAEAELDAKKSAFAERAAALGVDPERLNELENKTLGKKFTNLFKSSSKKEKEEAALMGMEVEEYREWKKTYEASINKDKDKDDKITQEKATTELAQNMSSNGGITVPATSSSNKSEKINSESTTGTENDPTNKPKEKKHWWQRAKSAAKDIGKWMFGGIKGPKAAADKFSKEHGAIEKSVSQAFQSDPESAIQFGKNIADSSAKGQQKRIDTLDPEFAKRVNALLNDPQIKGTGVKIREGYRPALTQLAYYSKGRAPNNVTDSLMKEAGYKDGINFWAKGFQKPGQYITWTLGSNHLDGKAVDLEPGSIGYDKIAQVASKYGIEWGGTWKTKDEPHFEMDRSWKGKIDDAYKVATVPHVPSYMESSSSQSKSADGKPTAESRASIEVQTGGNRDAVASVSEGRASVEISNPQVEDVTQTNDLLRNNLETLADKGTQAMALNRQASEEKSRRQTESTIRSGTESRNDVSHEDMVAQTAAIERQTQIMEQILALNQSSENRQIKEAEERKKRYQFNGQTYENPHEAVAAARRSGVMSPEVNASVQDSVYARGGDVEEYVERLAEIYCDVVS